MTTTSRTSAPRGKKAAATSQSLPMTPVLPTAGTEAETPVATLTFFLNSKGAPVGDLYLGTRRLLATTHPATIVAALFAMGIRELTVTTTSGSHTAKLDFIEADGDFPPLPAVKLRMQLNPRLSQFRHLAPAESFLPLLEGLDLFAHENWHCPTELADEHLRAAHHHLPKDLITRPLTTPDPKGWKKTLHRRNGWVYFPLCA